MSPESLEQLIARAREALNKARPANPDARIQAIVFGSTIGKIGRRLVAEPGRLAEVRDFVAETAETIAGRTSLGMWIHAVWDAAEPVNAEPEHYQVALRMRSDLEFFRDLYRDSAAREMIEEMDVSDIDDRLERLAPHYYISAVPPDIPPHHVWWHRHDRAQG